MAKKIKNKKKLNYILVSAVIVVAVVIGSVFLVSAINNSVNKNQTVAESSKPAVDKLKDKAIEYMGEADYKHARQMFETAKKQYEYVYEHADEQAAKDDARMNMVDCDTQLKMIEFLENR